MNRAAGLVLGVATLTVLALAIALNDGDAQSARTVAERSTSAQPRPAIPIVEQVFRNNCETAALSMLLAWDRVRVDQLTLQRMLVRSGPLDPFTSSDGLLVWGDPDKGFVGRAEGGGVAGGYGVYQGPIRRLAAKHGVQLVDLSRKPATTIYARLARGIPVMVWIGLSDGPYRRWVTPAGKPVSVNLGEHTVVLTGLRNASITVHDPLVGQRTTWSKAGFELLWSRLGRRALSY